MKHLTSISKASLIVAIALSLCGCDLSKESVAISAGDQASDTSPISDVASALPPSFGLQTVYKGSALEHFIAPTYRDRPMVRMWFPDAGAGLDPFDTVGKQIKALADGGFGGVEVTMLADGADFTNDQARVVGWGTEAWRETLKKVFQAANDVPGGFAVDITITPHWPMIISGIDPNDNAASQEVSHTIKKLTATDISAGTVDLPLPQARLRDITHSAPSAPFIFTDTHVSTVLLKVADVDAEGRPRFELGSLIDLSAQTAEVPGEGHAAGVPDRAAAEKYGFDYDEVVAQWGAEPAADADLSSSFNGKVDTSGNRARMRDWQHEYRTELSSATRALAGYTPSAGSQFQAGDLAVVSVFRRGTGQVMSDGGFGGISVMMYGRTYVTDYFSKAGVDAVTHFWETNILDDELRALLKSNRSSIFEDSIEAAFSTAFWSSGLKETLQQREYTHSAAMPAVIALGADAFDDENLGRRIRNDYNDTLGALYETEHLKPISAWAGTFNYSYRAQARGVTGVDQFSSAAVVDIPEGDNGTKGDGIRQLAGAARMRGNSVVSMEAVTGFGNLKLNWADVLTEVTQNFSHGVNQVILHGSPYNKTWNGYMSDWTGWQAFGNNFAGSYSYRQVYWEDVATMGDYMARIQAVLQNGVAKTDIIVIGNPSSNSFQNLLDLGYSYHLSSDALLDMPTAVVEGGRLNAHGPAYKAVVVVGDAPALPKAPQTPPPPPGNAAAEAAAPPAGQRPEFEGPDNIAVSFEPEPPRLCEIACLRNLREIANAGLPVILVNIDTHELAGTARGEETDVLLRQELEALKSSENVIALDNREEVPLALRLAGVLPDIHYSKSGLENTQYLDTIDGARYFLLYNDSLPDNAGMINTGHGARFKSGLSIATNVRIEGSGRLFELDPWTGDIHPITEYHEEVNGGLSTFVQLPAGGAKLIAVLPNEMAATATDVTSTDPIPATGLALQAIDLTEANWSLELESFGPDHSGSNIQQPIVAEFETAYTIYKDPSVSTRTVVQFDNTALVSWWDLPATTSQLQTLGVSSMQDVSGIGMYRTRFALPPDWNSATPAVLEFAYRNDQVTRITINGTLLDRIDIISDQVAITGLLKPGENTLTIKVDSSLFNRARVESSVFGLPGPQINGNEPVRYGLESVRIVPMSAAPPEFVTLKSFWHDERIDFFETATDMGQYAALNVFGYSLSSDEAQIYKNEQPGTVSLDLYWSEALQDNASVADADSITAVLKAGYERKATEGFIFPTQQDGTIALNLYYNEQLADYRTSTVADATDFTARGYVLVRTEGYVYPVNAK